MAATIPEMMRALRLHRDRVEPVDLVLDLVGGELLQQSWATMKVGGRLVSVVETPNPAAAERAGQGRYFIVEPDRGQLGKLAGLIDAGQLRPIVGRVFDLFDGAKAFDAKQGGGLPGKVVLQVAPSAGSEER
jgi:NADPH:quinone reductase-like Zn-dependent oxidoreductase